MTGKAKAIILVAVACAIGAVLVAKRDRGQAASVADSVANVPSTAPATTRPVAAAAIPRIVCLGAGKCIPCKMMEPVREALRKDYAGRLTVEFFDVWVNPDIGAKYGINTIPTTIFYDAAGKELGRRTGYMPKEDVLIQFAQYGIEL